ncbi:MAG: type II toxin-antitoxin system HipA family toxin YjjJ [Opitutales bacterium]
MPAYPSSGQDLLSYLQINGPTPSSVLVSHFGISRPTLSRRVQELGDRIVSIGHARATQLAARHEDVSGAIPLYSVLENGQVARTGQLTPIRAGSHTQWRLTSKNALSALCSDEFKDGLYPGWPWFLEDLRPTGFLGRAFGKRMARLFQIREKPEIWSDLELLTTLTGFGANLQGNFILGDGRALEDFQNHKVKAADGYYANNAPQISYSEFAQRALSEDEEYGSSAGGEQPKFTTMVCDTPEQTPRAVIVKFSPRITTPVGRRWADLLHAEHIANEVLRKAAIATARTRIFQFEERVFLESERFDRVGATGRRGLISLRALDAAYIGQGGGSWADCARKLHAAKWITAEDRDRMVQLRCFGELIANADMHFGNLSFFLPNEAPYPLAPVYDMLPMHFRPSGTGEVVERSFEPKLPKPEDQAAWLEMHLLALNYWQQVQQCPDISTDFQKIAGQAITALQHIHKIANS